MDNLPVPGPTAEQLEQENILATKQLLDILGEEFARHRAEVRTGQIPRFSQDHYTDAEGLISDAYGDLVRDPADDRNEYLVRLESDGSGKVTMLQRKREGDGGGVASKVELTLRQGQPTVAFGFREGRKEQGLEADDDTGNRILKSEHVPAEHLTRLGENLQGAFDARRQAQRGRTLAGKIGLMLGWAFRPPRENTRYEQLPDKTANS